MVENFRNLVEPSNLLHHLIPSFFREEFQVLHTLFRVKHSLNDIINITQRSLLHSGIRYKFKVDLKMKTNFSLTWSDCFISLVVIIKPTIWLGTMILLKRRRISSSFARNLWSERGRVLRILPLSKKILCMFEQEK